MMGYRTLEISTSCEIHIKEGQLEVTSDSGSILIPIEDFNNIYMVTGEPDYQEKTVGVNCHIMI